MTNKQKTFTSVADELAQLGFTYSIKPHNQVDIRTHEYANNDTLVFVNNNDKNISGKPAIVFQYALYAYQLSLSDTFSQINSHALSLFLSLLENDFKLIHEHDWE